VSNLQLLLLFFVVRWLNKLSEKQIRVQRILFLGQYTGFLDFLDLDFSWEDYLNFFRELQVLIIFRTDCCWLQALRQLSTLIRLYNCTILILLSRCGNRGYHFLSVNSIDFLKWINHTFAIVRRLLSPITTLPKATLRPSKALRGARVM
jgi:hypothetical protein